MMLHTTFTMFVDLKTILRQQKSFRVAMGINWKQLRAELISIQIDIYLGTLNSYYNY